MAAALRSANRVCSRFPGRCDARFHCTVQPPVIGGEIEFADAAGNGDAALDAHQPVVVAQVLADLAVGGQ